MSIYRAITAAHRIQVLPSIQSIRIYLSAHGNTSVWKQFNGVVVYLSALPDSRMRTERERTTRLFIANDCLSLISDCDLTDHHPRRSSPSYSFGVLPTLVDAQYVCPNSMQYNKFIYC